MLPIICSSPLSSTYGESFCDRRNWQKLFFFFVKLPFMETKCFSSVNFSSAATFGPSLYLNDIVQTCFWTTSPTVCLVQTGIGTKWFCSNRNVFFSRFWLYAAGFQLLYSQAVFGAASERWILSLEVQTQRRCACFSSAEYISNVWLVFVLQTMFLLMHVLSVYVNSNEFSDNIKISCKSSH